MTAAVWVIAVLIAFGIAILGWFGLQASLMQSRVMAAVVGQQERLMSIVENQTRVIATIRIAGQFSLPDSIGPERQAAEETYTDVWNDRPVGSG